MRADSGIHLLARQATPEPDPGEVMPLVGYSPFWLVLGLAILAALAAFTVFVVLFTSGRRERVADPVPATPPVDLVALQQDAFDEVAQIEAEAKRGSLDSRSAHERLSAVVREYIANATGIPADRMTLSDLQRTELTGTTRAVAQFYPGVFNAEAEQDLAKSIRLAREVLSGWR